MSSNDFGTSSAGSLSYWCLQKGSKQKVVVRSKCGVASGQSRGTLRNVAVLIVLSFGLAAHGEHNIRDCLQ